jgi:hypothetical protein
MRNISGKLCRENQNTHFVFSNVIFFENRSVHEIMWRDIVERGRPQMTIWLMRIACWIPKGTNTHSQYLLLTGFPTVTMVAPTRLNVTLHVLCLSSSIYCLYSCGTCRNVTRISSNSASKVSGFKFIFLL